MKAAPDDPPKSELYHLQLLICIFLYLCTQPSVKSSDVSSKSRAIVSLTRFQCLGLIAGFFSTVINGNVCRNLSILDLKILMYALLKRIFLIKIYKNLLFLISFLLNKIS
ncbi:hypothetical protein PUN28_001713 [Cardiocondyla obscurior]|uniref:Uncharacterized protein n=1 Tax=Cardiocondyla obscurior TaxID=286306 RepID=A0AAW2GQX0_9HYME